MFKPKQLTIIPTYYSGIYRLRITQNTSILKDGVSAHLSIYGNKKIISKAFHKALEDLGLPKDRLNWKKIDMGRMSWDIED